jgi:hypothetical protein
LHKAASIKCVRATGARQPFKRRRAPAIEKYTKIQKKIIILKNTTIQHYGDMI